MYRAVNSRSWDYRCHRASPCSTSPTPSAVRPKRSAYKHVPSHASGFFNWYGSLLVHNQHTTRPRAARRLDRNPRKRRVLRLTSRRTFQSLKLFRSASRVLMLPRSSSPPRQLHHQLRPRVCLFVCLLSLTTCRHHPCSRGDAEGHRRHTSICLGARGRGDGPGPRHAPDALYESRGP